MNSRLSFAKSRWFTAKVVGAPLSLVGLMIHFWILTGTTSQLLLARTNMVRSDPLDEYLWRA
jgi:hypothetical protein